MNAQYSLSSFLPGVLVGIFGLVSVYLGHRLGTGREAASKATDARIRRRQRWEENDERSLIAMQDKMAEFMESASKFATSATILVSNKTENLSDTKDFTIAQNEIGVSQAVLFNHITRIYDEDTRLLAVAFLTAGVRSYEAAGKLIPERAQKGTVNLAALREANQAMTTAFLAASGRIGERIRSEIKAEHDRAMAEATAEQLRRERSPDRRAIEAWRWVSRRFRKPSHDVA